MEVIEFNYSHNDDYVYVFDYDDTYAIANKTDWDSVIEVDAQQLENYIIRAVKSREFLWFACSLDDASNGTYISLIPHENDEDAEND